MRVRKLLYINILHKRKNKTKNITTYKSSNYKVKLKKIVFNFYLTQKR